MFVTLMYHDYRAPWYEHYDVCSNKKQFWGANFASVLFKLLLASLYMAPLWVRIYIYGPIYGWKIDSLFEFFNVMYYKSTNPRKQRIVRSRRNFAGEVSNFVQLLSIWRFDYFLTKIWKTANIWPRTILRLGYLEYRSLDWGSSVGSGWVTQHQARGFQKTKVFTI